MIGFVGRVAKYQLVQKQDGQIGIECQSENRKNTYTFSEQPTQPIDAAEGFTPMISRRNPQREAGRLLGNFQLSEGLIGIVFGAASIYLLEKLLKQQKRSGGLIILIESDVLLMEALIKHSHLSFEKIFLLTTENQSMLMELIENLNIESLLGYRIFKNPISVQLDRAFYDQMENELKVKLASRFSDLFTRLEFEPKWIQNSFSQIPFFVKARPVNQLFGKAKGMKAILVSSGPSLRSDLPYLKKNQNQFFIACVDSVYRVLVRAGIRPHLIISLDAQAYTLRHFLGLPHGKKNKYPILYSDLVTNPSVIRAWRGPLFFGVTAQYRQNTRETTTGSDYIEAEVRRHNPDISNGLGDVQSGGSVATSLFDLLRQMSFDTIILVGQDLAYTHREIHCTGTHHTDTWLSQSTHRFESIENINQKVIKKRNTNNAVSIQGGRVIADYVLSLYRQWFQDAGLNGLGVEVLNATRNGLPIQNIPSVSLAEVEPPEIKPSEKSDRWLKNGHPILPQEAVHEITGKILDAPFSNETQERFPFMKSIGRGYEIQLERKQANGQAKEGLKKKRSEQQKKVWSKLQSVLSAPSQ